MIIYFIKLNVALALLFGFYKVAFARDTFFAWRRAALIGIYLMATAVPGLNMAYWIASNSEAHSVAAAYAQVVLPAVSVQARPDTATYWQPLLFWGYMAVVLLLLIRFAVQLFSIYRLARKCPAMEVNGVRVHVLTGEQGPFSFFRMIFLNPSRHSREELEEILLHEQTHCRQLHSADVLLCELYAIAFWLNPFVWLMRREVRINLEYMADHRVLSHGTDSKSYQYHLVGLTYHKNVATISNNFNVLPLKQRIKMMNKQRSKGIKKAKYLLFAPLAATLLLVSNIETVARSIKTSMGEVPVLGKMVKAIAESDGQSTSVALMNQQADGATVSDAATAEELPMQETVQPATSVLPGDTAKAKEYIAVDQMPSFKGNVNVWIMQNLKYPAEAVKNNEHGRVVVRFLVSKTGKVIKPAVIRGVSPALDAEALRIVSSMPDWNPGYQDGKPADVWFVLPVSFSMKPDGESGSRGTSATLVRNTAKANETTRKSEKETPQFKIYLDGKKISDAESKNINAETIRSIDVDKSDNAIRISTSEKK